MKDPLIQVLLGERFKNCWLFLLILIPNIIAALLEGMSFGFLLLSFAAMNGEKIFDVATHPFLRHLPWLETLQTMQSIDLFILFVVGAVALQIIRSLAGFIGQYYTLILTIRMQTDAQKSIYQQIFRLSFSCASRYKVGDLVEYARTPVTFMNYVMEALNRCIVSVLMVISSLIVMWFLSPSLTLFTLLFFSLFALGQRWVIKKIKKGSEGLANRTADLSMHTVQCLHGIRTIYTFDRQKGVLSKLFQMLTEIAKTVKKLNLWNNIIISVNEASSILLVGICLVIGSFLLKGDQALLLPVLLTFITVSYRLTVRVQAALTNWGTIAINFGYILRLREILRNEDKDFAPIGGIDFPGLKNKIEFLDVCLQYDHNNSPAVKNLHLTVKKGEVVALVGASGAGKSSISDLLLRLYEPTSGKIQIDGVDLTTFDVSAWRGVLGVVSQDAFIFNESVEENIRFGLNSAPHDEIVEAAKAAGAHEFIMQLSEGYQTIVGERGYRLSGGERQRLALARALLRNPEILILDEATSNLDSHSEQLMQDSLERFNHNRTVIIIAHRLSTISKADKIIVLDKGLTIERGNHEELLSLNGKYAQLWTLQSRQVARQEA